MKNLCYFLIAFVIGNLQAQTTFYGTQVITYSYEGEGAEMMAQYMPQGMTAYYGKDKSATDFKGAAMEAMMNRVVSTPNESFAISHNSKTVYKMDNDFIEQNQPTGDNINITKNEGETKQILGLTCQKYTLTMNQDGIELTMHLYLTDKYVLPDYILPFNQDASAKALKDAGIKGMVLRVESNIPVPGANIKMTMETTKLDPTAVSETVFDKPEGYTEKNFAEMPMGGY